MNRNALVREVEGPEIRISSRDFEHQIFVARQGASMSEAVRFWQGTTALVVDHPNVVQAFEEGYQAALRQMDMRLGRLREQENKNAES